MAHISIPHSVTFLLISLNLSLPSSSWALGGLFPPGHCGLFMQFVPFTLAGLYLSTRVSTCMGDRKRKIQYLSQQRRLRGGQSPTCCGSECTQAWSVLGQHYLVQGIKFCLHSPWQVEHTKGKPWEASGNPVLIKELWLRPACSMWQGLRAGKAKSSCTVHSPRFARTCTWAEVSANVSSREVISDTSLWLESSRTKPQGLHMDYM